MDQSETGKALGRILGARLGSSFVESLCLCRIRLGGVLDDGRIIGLGQGEQGTWIGAASIGFQGFPRPDHVTAGQ